MNSPGNIQAVVLSGGGAYGAYELGVLRALFESKSPGTDYQSLNPDIFCGTSIGSFNATYLATQWDTFGTDSLNKLEEVWHQNLCSEGGIGDRISSFRLRMNPLDLLRPSCYRESLLKPPTRFLDDMFFLGMSITRRVADVAISQNITLAERFTGLFNMSDFISVDPWKSVIETNIDFEALANSSRILRVAATNWNKGEVRVFDKVHMHRRQGVKILLASSAIPGLFSPVFLGSQQFVDGGVLMNTPLKPAISANADVIHVINMEGAIIDQPLPAIPNTMDTFYRQQLVGWSDTIGRDMERVRSYNRAISHIENHQDKPEATEDFKQLIFRLGKHGKKGRKYRQLTVHLYRPSVALGGLLGLLDLRPKRVADLIAHGFDDAVTHNCEESGCIIAGET